MPHELARRFSGRRRPVCSRYVQCARKVFALFESYAAQVCVAKPWPQILENLVSGVVELVRLVLEKKVEYIGKWLIVTPSADVNCFLIQSGRTFGAHCSRAHPTVVHPTSGSSPVCVSVERAVIRRRLRGRVNMRGATTGATGVAVCRRAESSAGAATPIVVHVVGSAERRRWRRPR